MAIDSEHIPHTRPGVHVLQAAIAQILSSAFPGPDDSEPHGPGAPVIRDLITLLATYEMISQVSQSETRVHLEKALASAIQVQAQHLVHLSGGADVSLNPQPLPPDRDIAP